MTSNRRRKNILLILALAQLLVVLDSAIINVALPAIKTALRFEASTLQWVLTGYILTFGGFLMLGGRTADLFGRRRVLVLGIAGFVTFSLLAGLSTSSTMLIAFRALQGTAGAFMAPAALSILLTTFQEGEERNQALSIWSVVASGGAAVGVFLGGVLTQYLGWRWNFFVNVPIGILTIVGVLRWVPRLAGETIDRNLDLPGAVLVTSGLMALVYALTLATQFGWATPATLASLAVSLALLGGFIFNETRTKHPLVPFSIFRLRNVSGGNLLMLPVMAGNLGLGFFASLYIQNVLHYSPAATGLSFLPIPIIIGVISIRAPRLLDRFGVKPLLIAGTALMSLSVFMLSLLNETSSYVLNLLPAFVILSVGVGLSIVAISVAATTGVRNEDTGLASGLLNTSQEIGGALGLAVLAAVASAGTASGAAAGLNQTQASLLGYQQAFLCAAALMAVALPIAIFVIRTPKKRKGCESPAVGEFDLDGC
jgi:EmrB/QacA subfamily drug resistance transporter